MNKNKEKEKKLKVTLDKNTKNILSLISNALFIVFTIYCLIRFYTVGGTGNMLVDKSDCFKYYTVDSNILCMLGCIAVLIYNIRGNGIPKWALKIKFAGCVSVGVTFTVVMTFLGPNLGYKQMFEGINIFLHLISPLLGIVSFIVFDGEIQLINRFGDRKKNKPISKREGLIGVVPTFIYGLVYVYFVIIAKTWEDFYNFNSGYLEGKIPIVYLAILALALIIGVIIRALHIRLNKEYQIRGYTL